MSFKDYQWSKQSIWLKVYYFRLCKKENISNEIYSSFITLIWWLVKNAQQIGFILLGVFASILGVSVFICQTELEMGRNKYQFLQTVFPKENSHGKKQVLAPCSFPQSALHEILFLYTWVRKQYFILLSF